MFKTYLIKRNSDYTERRIIKKRNQKNKGYSEKVFTSNNRKPPSEKFQIGDLIYVAETKNGVYALGKVTSKSPVLKFYNCNQVIKYVLESKKKESSFWMEVIKDFTKRKTTKKNVILKYQEYTINQKLLERVIPLNGELKRLSQKGLASPVLTLNESEIKFLENPEIINDTELKNEIPSRLKMDLYSLFNKNLQVSHWIDIDHFVPKSAGGPGNIIENLVPVGLSLNRYKGNSIPTGLFKVASEMNDLKKYCKKYFFKKEQGFLKQTKYPEAFKNACKINEKVKSFHIDDAKEFYKKVMSNHHPEYVRIINSFS